MARRVVAGVALWVAAAGLSPATVSAQLTRRPPPPLWANHYTLTAANAVLGIVTVGVSRLIRGEPVWEGLPAGALGGALGYAGRYVAVDDFEGAGFLGREINAVGASVVANASRGDGWLDELALPVGPVHLYVRPWAEDVVTWRVDVADVGWIAWASLHPRMQVEWGRSLSTGTPTFRTRGGVLHQGGDIVNGLGVGGVVLVDHVAKRNIEDHELVHVLELDFIQHTMGRPVEHALLDELFPESRWTRHVDPGLIGPALAGLLTVFGERRPGGVFEAEALLLERRR